MPCSAPPPFGSEMTSEVPGPSPILPPHWQPAEAYRGRILNIHPSLLPLFPGLEPQKQVLEHGAKTSGCTVHFVDETLDGGPIIAQREVPVHKDDTVERLAARILIEEHKLYPEAVKQVLAQLHQQE